ncbi:MAG: hypothetical protein M1274_04930 [Actinobacteria bacterium]|nr:hypothetical protein [Actinomycetota bacterium]
MHRTTDQFWERYRALPEDVRKAADKSFQLLKENPRHPSLQLKKVGNFWSARVDLAHRALAVEDEDGFVWVWVGDHSDYEKITKKA